jgi:glucose/arabinose dehydrogenase
VAGLGAADPPGFDVREGYRVSVVIDDLPGARFLAFDDNGTLLVTRPQVRGEGRRRNGDIASFRDEDGDGVYERIGTFVDDKPSVHGIQVVDGWVWFTTSDAVYRGRDTNADGVADEVVTVLSDLPSGGHWWRPILVTGDHFYTSVGDGGNITDQRDTDRQKIWIYDLDGSNKRLYCSGIRNTEKLLVRPGTDEIWGFDHGSDWFGRELGDEQGNQPITDLNPPDELNKYVQDGFYGHPFVVGNRLVRYEFMEMEGIHELAAQTIPPEWPMGAHWACNGWTFIDPKVNQATGAMPSDHEGDIFVAAHGSWNSGPMVGYCVARVLFDDAKPYGMLKIVSTLDSDGRSVHGRPADVIQAPDGTLLFSDDHSGRVYRIEHVGD